jgi:hypothetical protein
MPGKPTSSGGTKVAGVEIDAPTREVPKALQSWLNEHGATATRPDVGLAPFGDHSRLFVLATVPLKGLEFELERYNPRIPSQKRVDDLFASIGTLSLLSPLMCAFVGDKRGNGGPIRAPAKRKGNGGDGRDSRSSGEEPSEPVVLLDGRHRFKALRALARANPDWGKAARVDLKIYYHLPISDLFLLATYLNKTRKALAKGEYYRFIVDIYESRFEEVKSNIRRIPTEKEVYSSVQPRELTDKNFDLSVGRLVGLIAFAEEEKGSWYPYVSSRQLEKLTKDEDPSGGYKPLTAGNLATFLGHLCRIPPYEDDGHGRAIEMTNLRLLGEEFRAHLLRPLKKYDEASATSVACKHWCIDALGTFMAKEKSSLVNGKVSSGIPLLAYPDIRWGRVVEILSAYYKAMGPQAARINRYKKTKDLADLKMAWSYQTQTSQVLYGLRPELEGAISWL